MLSDIMGLTDNDYIYNQSRAHSADMLFFKMRAWFWGITASVACLCLGNIAGVFGVNIFGFIFSIIGELL